MSVTPTSSAVSASIASKPTIGVAAAAGSIGAIRAEDRRRSADGLRRPASFGIEADDRRRCRR
jgi:hypothetical protein